MHDTLQSTMVLSLPDDLLLSSFARISRLHYPALSLVSKSFRSLLISPELYETRSLLGRTESCLYVCLQYAPDPNPNAHWFTLCHKPNRTLTHDNTSEKKKTKYKSSGNILVPIPVPNSPQTHWQSVVTVGSSIYVIGGPIKYSPSSDVWVLDCRCHVWRKGPSMLAERYYPSADVVDGKIYVVGGGNDLDSSNWMEVFDPKTQTWEFVVCPHAERYPRRVVRSAVIEGIIFYMFTNEGMTYNPKEDRWEAVGGMSNMDSGWPWLSYCVVVNVLCACIYNEGFKWYDFQKHCWKELKGLPKFAAYCHVQMADYGGKLAVLWKNYLLASGCENKKVWCAVVAIERRNGDKEIWGKVEWLDHLLTIPKSYVFVRALSPTV